MLRLVTPPNVAHRATSGRPLPAGSVALRQAIVDRGLTQAQAAYAMDVSERTLRHWLAGDSDPPLSAYLRLLEVPAQRRAA